MDRLRIILADDHPVVRGGVRLLLERDATATVVAEAGTPEALFEAMAAHPADLVLTDFSMPGGSTADGLGMLARLRRRWPQVPVVVLTMAGNAAVLPATAATWARPCAACSRPTEAAAAARCRGARPRCCACSSPG